MKGKTIQGRITTVLAASLVLVGLIGGLALYYLAELSRNIGQVIRKDVLVVRGAEKVKGTFLDLQRAERLYWDSLGRSEPVLQDIQKDLDGFREALDEHLQLATAPENRQVLTQLSDLFEKYRTVLREASGGQEPEQIRAEEKKAAALGQEMGELIDGALSLRYLELDRHQADIQVLIANANRNMLLFLLLSVGGGVLLVSLAPSRVTAPFKKFIAAINQVEELKFDTRLPETGYREIAQVGRSINRLVDRIRTFDELKQKKIQFEARKQRVLANMVDLGVMLLTVEGEILFMNAQLAKTLNLGSEAYQYKNFRLVSLPEEIKDMVQDVLKKKQRMDSRMMILVYREKAEKEGKAVECNVDAGLVRDDEGAIANVVITFEDISSPGGQSVFKRITIVEQELI